MRIISQHDYIKLSDLMQSIEGVIQHAFSQACWVVAEVAEISTHAKSGHTYLTLVELAYAKQVARVRATVWRTQYQNTMGQFYNATGVNLTAGVRILCLVQVQAHPLYGLSLSLLAIDPVFTLGDIEQKKQHIRQQLIQEGISDLNKQTVLPTDIFRVAVIAPYEAAGLGDFEKEAEILQLHGVVDFYYFNALFQGDKVIGSVCHALTEFEEMHAESPFDVLVIIRGGGAALDLNYVNEYEIVRRVALCPVPVWTGIGHERDSTLLDEQAHTIFDTPSKVAQGIVNVIQHRASETTRLLDEIIECVGSAIGEYERCLSDLNVGIVNAVRMKLVREESKAQSASRTVCVCADAVLKYQKQQVAAYTEQVKVRVDQRVKYNIQALKRLNIQLFESAGGVLKDNRKQYVVALQSLVAHALNRVNQNRRHVQTSMLNINARIAFFVKAVRLRMTMLSELIVLSGPANVLKKGYALLKTTDGQVLANADINVDDTIMVVTNNQILEVSVSKVEDNNG